MTETIGPGPDVVKSVALAIVDATASGGAHGPDCVTGSRYATPIANAPLIAHVFEELRRSGVSRVRLITPHSVRKDLGRLLGGHPGGLQLSYVDAPEQDARPWVLAELEDALASEPVLLHPGDSLFREQVRAMNHRFSDGDVDSVLPEQASVIPLRDPAQRRVAESVVVMGARTRAIVAGLRPPSAEGEDLIESLLTSDCRLAVCAGAEHWSYSETTESLLAVNRMILDGSSPPPLPAGVREANQIQGRVAISPSAHVSNSVIHGPVSIDDRAVVEDAFIGPFTAIATDAVINGAEIDNSMVLAGAEVHHPGIRIEGSIVGERCSITRSFELPQGLHVRLRSGSRLRLS